ncbi:amidohydrolase family protein [Parvularcula oceani]|uniref:amidohydrolase family protein n=1 Tax=Parvularcula oceani TaxID=1247963 RepID=UPI000B32BAAD|nr:amidohydrolase family protein [Parvularcula oceani]
MSLLAVSGMAAAADILITDVTVIDGTGAAPMSGRTVAIEDGRIIRIGRARDDEDADTVIDGSGLYLLPGFIDSNVHLTVYGNARRRETVVRYGPRNEELALESAQRHLAHGVTTVRDSYGDLQSLLAVRDRIEAGEATGARMLVAGNIVGWGGPFSITFSLLPEDELTHFQQTWNDRITQGVGEELMDMGPEGVREAINAYLDKGVDFIKYGGSGHFRRPVLIGFSPRVQEVIVEETHERGKIAETHATSQESLRLAVEAGIDLIQHPEILSADYPDDLIELIVEEDVLCAMRPNMLTGRIWSEHLERREAALAAQSEMPPPATGAQENRRAEARGDDLELQRRNARRLIAAGCPVTIATDNYQGDAPELRGEPKPLEQEAGMGSLLAIEGLVELGMTPMEALMAATRNGARAAGMADEIGAIEEGMIADLVLLGSNPLDDIANVHDIEAVIAKGRVIDIDSLPEQRIFSVEAPALSR